MVFKTEMTVSFKVFSCVMPVPPSVYMPLHRAASVSIKEYLLVRVVRRKVEYLLVQIIMSLKISQVVNTGIVYASLFTEHCIMRQSHLFKGILHICSSIGPVISEINLLHLRILSEMVSRSILLMIQL